MEDGGIELMQAIGTDNSSTFKFVAYDAVAHVWTGAAFEAWNDSHFASYGITATRLGTTFGYSGSAPTGTVRFELWLWTGTLSTSYAVWAEDVGAILRNITVTERFVTVG